MYSFPAPSNFHGLSRAHLARFLSLHSVPSILLRVTDAYRRQASSLALSTGTRYPCPTQGSILAPAAKLKPLAFFWSRLLLLFSSRKGKGGGEG